MTQDNVTIELAQEATEKTAGRSPRPSRFSPTVWRVQLNQNGLPSLGIATVFDYDQMDRIVKETDPAGNWREYQYNSLGWIVQSGDSNGNAFSFDYDAMGRLKKKTAADNGYTFDYDNMDNLTMAEDSDSKVLMMHDQLGFVELVKTLSRGDAKYAQPGKNINYEYDANGNRTRLQISGAQITEYVFQYDNMNWLKRIEEMTGAKMYAVDFEYTGAGQRKKVIISDKVTGNELSIAEYDYDTAGRLKKVVNDTDASVFEHTDFDVFNNRKNMTESRDGAAVGTHAYNYDNLSRLTSAAHPAAYGAGESYSYDPSGNRLGGGRIYNGANQLTSDSACSYSYDGNGNMESRNCVGYRWDYGYNSDDQLVTAAKYGGAGNTTLLKSVKYGYDALGRRIWKEVDGVVREKYVYDSEDVALDYDGNNNVTAKYFHGPGIDEPLWVERGGLRYFYHYDGLGSVTEITDEAGDVVNRYWYDSFGNQVKKECPSLSANAKPCVPNRYTYTGREWDDDTGLYYYRARWYDAVLGRFLQEDPIGGMADYIAFSNNPLQYSDPSGLWSYKKGTPMDKNCEIASIEQEVDAAYMAAAGANAVVTSTTYDSKEHMTGSKHYTGDAVDIGTKTLTGLTNANKREIAADIANRVGEDYDVAFEPRLYNSKGEIVREEHIHAEYDPDKPLSGQWCSMTDDLMSWAAPIE